MIGARVLAERLVQVLAGQRLQILPVGHQVGGDIGAGLRQPERQPAQLDTQLVRARPSGQPGHLVQVGLALLAGEHAHRHDLEACYGGELTPVRRDDDLRGPAARQVRSHRIGVLDVVEHQQAPPAILILQPGTHPPGKVLRRLCCSAAQAQFRRESGQASHRPGLGVDPRHQIEAIVGAFPRVRGGQLGLPRTPLPRQRHQRRPASPLQQPAQRPGLRLTGLPMRRQPRDRPRPPYRGRRPGRACLGRSGESLLHHDQRDHCDGQHNYCGPHQRRVLGQRPALREQAGGNVRRRTQRLTQQRQHRGQRHQ